MKNFLFIFLFLAIGLSAGAQAPTWAPTIRTPFRYEKVYIDNFYVGTQLPELNVSDSNRIAVVSGQVYNSYFDSECSCSKWRRSGGETNISYDFSSDYIDSLGPDNYLIRILDLIRDSAIIANHYGFGLLGTGFALDPVRLDSASIPSWGRLYKTIDSIGAIMYRPDTLHAYQRVNIGPVEDSMINRKGQLQILGMSGNFPDGVLSIIRTNTSNPPTIQTSGVDGSYSSPSAIGNNRVIGRWSMEGSDGSLTSGKATLRESMRIEGMAVGQWGGSNFGSKFGIDYTPKDSGAVRRIGLRYGDTIIMRPTGFLFLTRGSNLSIAGSTALFQTDGRMHTTKHLIEGNLRSSATSLTIVDSSFYIFTGGSDATWTLPPIGTPGRRIFIKNAGSAVLTVQRAGTDQIFTNALVNSFALLTGADRVLVDDGVYWQTFSN